MSFAAHHTNAQLLPPNSRSRSTHAPVCPPADQRKQKAEARLTTMSPLLEASLTAELLLSTTRPAPGACWAAAGWAGAAPVTGAAAGLAEPPGRDWGCCSLSGLPPLAAAAVGPAAAAAAAVAPGAAAGGPLLPPASAAALATGAPDNSSVARELPMSARHTRRRIRGVSRHWVASRCWKVHAGVPRDGLMKSGGIARGVFLGWGR